MATKKTPKVSVWCAGALVVLVSAGCTVAPPVVRNLPGTTYGEIYVGYPRLAGRERLVNDRLEQDTWLKAQLKGVDEQSLGFDGLVDLRNVLYSSAQLKVQIDPAYKLYAEQQAQALQSVRSNAATDNAAQQLRLAAVQQITAKVNKGELTVDQATAELEKLSVKYEEVKVGEKPSTAKPSLPELGAPTPTLDKSMPGSILLDPAKQSSLAPPKGSTAEATSLHGSAIDRFRDLIAVREEIRTAIIENGLDDAHDLIGNTLYRLTFDVTVRPRNDTSAFAVVELTASFVPPGRKVLEGELKRALIIETRRRIDFLYREIWQRVETVCQEEKVFSKAASCAIDELSTPDQSYISRVLEDPPWNERANVPLERTAGKFSSTSTLMLRLLLRDAEELRLRDSPAGCAFKIRSTTEGDLNALNLNQARRRPEKIMEFQSYSAKGSLPPYEGSTTVNADVSIDQRPKAEIPPACREDEDLVEKLQNGKIRVYAVTPRETVQRLSELGGNRTARELLLGLSAIAPAGGVSAAYQQLRANDALYQAIRRQPLVVGFGNLVPSVTASFGWILGPPFELTNNGASVQFRHQPKQQPVSATISAPKWLSTLQLCVQKYWLNEKGEKLLVDDSKAETATNSATAAPEFACDKGVPVEVSLPRRSSTLVEQNFEGIEREPSISVGQRIELTVGEPAQILISGSNLWRSTEVYVGAQKADRISLTPDMEGVHAAFDAIQEPSGSRISRKDGSVAVVIFTSEGRVQAGIAKIAPPKNRVALTATGLIRRLVAGEPSAFDLSARIGAYNNIEARIHDPSNVAFNAKSTDVRIAQDDRRVTVTFPATALPGIKTGQLIDVTLQLKRTPDSQPVELILGRNMIYFASADEARATNKLVGAPKTLPLEVDVRFSPAVLEGFGALAEKKAHISVQAEISGNTLALDDSSCNVRNASCRIKITAPASVAKSIAEAKDPWRLSLKFVDPDGPLLSPPEMEISPTVTAKN